MGKWGGSIFSIRQCPLLADSVEKLSSAAASWSAVPTIEVKPLQVAFRRFTELPCLGLRVNSRVSARRRRTYPVSGGP